MDLQNFIAEYKYVELWHFNEMANISQPTYLNILFKYLPHILIQLRIIQDWSMRWLGAEQETGYYQTADNPF